MRFYKYTPEIVGGLFLDSWNYEGLFYLYDDLLEYEKEIKNAK